MPTAAKIVAAICFLMFGAIAATTVKPELPEGTQFGYFIEISAFIGLLNGWFIMGRLAGHGYRDAMGAGVRTAITVVIWALLVFAINKMIILSTQLRYDGPMEAVTAAFGIMLDYGKLLLTPTILGTFFVGGLMGGAVTEWAAKRWP
jgi:hypothetical protein